MSKTASPGRVMGVAEVAQLLGVTRSAVSTWRRRGQMPEPWAVLECGPLWWEAQFEHWVSPAKLRGLEPSPRETAGASARSQPQAS